MPHTACLYTPHGDLNTSSVNCLSFFKNKTKVWKMFIVKNACSKSEFIYLYE